MKNLKKTLALVLALAMVLAMGSSAFATDLSSGKTGSGGNSAALISGESINIKKELKPVNPENSTINAPTITYTYAVSAGAAAQSITDSADVNVNTKAGVLTGLKVKGSENGTAHTSAVTYSSGDSVSDTISWTTAKSLTANTSDYQNLEIDFSGVEFGASGVYRYVITESATYTGTGVKETDGTHTRYLDVYVKENSTETGAAKWDVYGFVCSYANNATIDAGTGATNNITSISKTNGFVGGSDNSGNAVAADTYYTYNVTISKTLTGDSFNNSHKFPFTVVFTNAGITANVDIIGTATGTADAADVSAGALSTAVTVNPNIANGGTAVYTGIPVGTSVAVYETNDNVGVTYTSVGTITTAENGDTNAASKAISYNVVSNTATVASTSANNAATGNKTVAFTNDFTLISPTGIVTRFAPYALILIGGVALLVIAMKKRKHTEED